MYHNYKILSSLFIIQVQQRITCILCACYWEGSHTERKVGMALTVPLTWLQVLQFQHREHLLLRLCWNVLGLGTIMGLEKDTVHYTNISFANLKDYNILTVYLCSVVDTMCCYRHVQLLV